MRYLAMIISRFNRLDNAKVPAGSSDLSLYVQGTPRATLRIRKPAPGTPSPNRVPLPKPLKTNVDVVQLLLEERQSHR